MKPGPIPDSLDARQAVGSLRLPESRPEVVAKLKELMAAWSSRDKALVELLEAEISGLAAREARAERAREERAERAREERAEQARTQDRPEPPAVPPPRIHQASLLEAHK